MDCAKVGRVIAALRKEKSLKQRELAEKLNVSPKTVSKWERGLGCPDVSALNELGEVLGTKVETVLGGILQDNEKNSGNMKKSYFYVCPVCGNIVAALSEMAIYCCGRKIEASPVNKATGIETLEVENIDGELFVSSGRSMSKEDYVTFVAYAVGDRLTLVKLYPEWSLQARFTRRGAGILTWGTGKGKLFYEIVK